jgi:predicted DNA-binding transcriptional regulator AlpA
MCFCESQAIRHYLCQKILVTAVRRVKQISFDESFRIGFFLSSQTKEFSVHFVTCSSFRVALQIATARFCTLLQRAAMNTPRSRRSLPTPTSPLLIDAATAAHLCGRSLRTWWSWHAAGRCPEPVRIGRSQLWRPDEIVAWVAAGWPARKAWGWLPERSMPPMNCQARIAGFCLNCTIGKSALRVECEPSLRIFQPSKHS